MSLNCDNHEQIAEAHWVYIKSVLETHGEGPGIISTIGFHYKTAFIHGWKHAKEDADAAKP
jgi:hypothetical protein